MATKLQGVTLDTSVLDKITDELRPRASETVERFGLLIAGDAAKAAPVDTGALRNSIVSESHMEGDLTFIIQDGVLYGIFLELGTSRMAAQPFVTPAVEKHAAKFLASFGEILEP